jgi:hypothetical protein
MRIGKVSATRNSFAKRKKKEGERELTNAEKGEVDTHVSYY